MRILLIMNTGAEHDYKVIVSLNTRPLIRELRTLVQDGHEKEAFDLAVSKAEVVSYIPPGKKIRPRPDLTLVEDML